ncbi:MAG: hypothetical protein AAGA28_10675 [Pseudomonadota bacterium]
MSIGEILNRYRETLPECELAAFGDLKSRLILQSSHTADIRRELLDSLCIEADRAFRVLGCLNGTGDDPEQPLVSLALTRHSVSVFAIGHRECSEFVCLSVRAPIASQSLMTAAEKLIAEIEMVSE